MHDVAVLNDVLLAFDSEFACCAACGFGFEVDKIIVLDDFCADEAFLEVGVDVFRVNKRDTGAFYTEDDAKSYADRMMQYSLQTILPVMMDDADVKDNRARFF